MCNRFESQENLLGVLDNYVRGLALVYQRVIRTSKNNLTCHLRRFFALGTRLHKVSGVRMYNLSGN
mgnify:CR=1 FL=1